MLKKLKRENPYPTLEKRAEAFRAGMESAVREEGFTVPFRTQGIASVFWGVFGAATGVVRSITQIPSAQKETYAQLFHALLARGVYLAPSGFEVSFLSTAHDEAALGRASEAWRLALRDIKKG
jgi:glutamate-1-semialdehyde 2,1-aminomutase